jgi:hypothetical protein
MAYTPLTWTDEVLADDERYDIKTDGGTPINSTVQIALATSVAVAGTPVTAANMNHIEQGIVNATLLTNRQGGNATDWSNTGTTNYAVSSGLKMQCGAAVTDPTTGAVTVTFPVAFTHPPIVTTGIIKNAAYLCVITNLTASSVSFLTAANAGSPGSCGVYWMAVGPIV